MALASALLLCGAAVGCSYSLSGPDPKRAKHQVPRCDTGKGLLVLDGIVGAVTGMLALEFLSSNETGAGLTFGLASGLAFGGVIRGNGKVNECRAELAAFEEEVRDGAVARPRGATTRMVKTAPPQGARPAPPPIAQLPPAAAAPTTPPRSSAPAVPATPPRPAPPTAAAPPRSPAPTTAAAPPRSPPPPATPPAVKPAASPRPPAAPTSAPDDDPWRDFWREEP